MATQSAAHADAFFREVLREEQVWIVRDQGGSPAPLTSDGVRAMPFWSLQSRAQKIIEAVPAYAEMWTESVALARWRENWLPDLENDGIRVGVNWSGSRATGYDFNVTEVLARLDAYAQGWRPSTGWPEESPPLER